MSFEDSARLFEGTGYEEEDASSTTGRELRGWYSYAIAAEVFAVVGVGLFIPVLLEQLPRERGFLFSDRSKPCVDPLGAGEPGRLSARDEVGGDEQCVVRFLGGDVTTTSFAMYTTSAAVLVQAVTLICFSSFADYGPYRKRLLLTFAYTGATFCALFLFLTPRIYYLAPLLVIISVTCLGSGFSLLNAFLPLLVSNDPSNRNPPPPTSASASTYELDDVAPPPNGLSDPQKTTQDLERSSQISSKGVGLGYASAVLFQLFAILLLIVFDKLNLAPGNPTFPLRVTLFLVAIWWFVFTLPTHLWLLPRPGPPLPNARSSSTFSSKSNPPTFYLTFSIKSFYKTLKQASHLPQLLKFLLAWFLLSDSISTISSTAILFARTELHLSTIPLVLLSLTSIFSSMLGATLWPLLAKRYSLPPKSILLLCIAILELIPLYGLLAFIPAIRSLGVLGIQRPWEIYVVAVVHGVVMGGISAYARSVYGGLVPRGKEAAFFALYAVTDKGSSAVGPAVVGGMVDRWGTIRPAFWFLSVLVGVAGGGLWWVDVGRGAEDVRVEGRGEGRGGYVRVEGEEGEEGEGGG